MRHCFQILLAVSKMEDPERERCRKIAQSILDYAASIDLIKATDRELAERMARRQLQTVQE